MLLFRSKNLAANFIPKKFGYQPKNIFSSPGPDNTGTLRVHSTHLARMDRAMLVLRFILAKANIAFCLAMLVFLKLNQLTKTVTKKHFT